MQHKINNEIFSISQIYGKTKEKCHKKISWQMERVNPFPISENDIYLNLLKCSTIVLNSGKDQEPLISNHFESELQ